MFKILSVNPGSTSTKFAVYEDETLLCLHTIRHSAEELKPYRKLIDQLAFRKDLVLDYLEKDGIELSGFSAVVGRGGIVRPIESGVYEVNDRMIADLESHHTAEHASNLGAVIAREIARQIPGCRALIADPVVVDEYEEVARISGLPQIPRKSQFHALNHKAIARKYAAANGTTYERLRLVVAHLGGGISVAAHRYGRVIDSNQGLDGYGPFSPERSGTLDAGQLVELCFSGKYSQDEIKKMLVGNGGLMAHLGINEELVAEKKAVSGDSRAKLVLDAMAYNIAKEIGAMLAVMEGQVDAVILTGGIAYSLYVVEFVKRMISPMAKVAVYPGEDEMEALAMSGLRVLRGEESKEY
ncbi:MAG TPA: butyrate kinase [Paludibacter sp.]|nr:butyrate kinase [Paludibacter sp.]